MAFSYLTEENIYSRYEAAKTHTERLSFPFPEFERIARNKPSSSIDPAYPKTTDGTTASIIRKTPKRIVQQLPTGTVENDAEDWLSVVAGFVLSSRIIPAANDEYDLIQKCWNIIEKSLTFGSSASYTPFLSHDGEFGPDLTLPYWGDVFIQPGKKSGYSSSYVFMRAWWQKEDIEALIDKETKLKSSAKERGEQYDSSWDLAALNDILEAESHKDSKASTPSEEERGTGLDGIELITGFQKGVGAKFYTFNPIAKKIVRTKVNKDPRGKMPIDFMYGDIDGSNPLGRGLVELLAGLQNLIDSDMQMYQFNRALMLAPPVIKRGSFSKNKIVYQPNHIIDVGTDAQADVIPLRIDTSAVANYPQLYQLQQSQLFNLVQSPQSNISTTDAALGQGKTPTALNQQKATISIDDNYVRKMFEAWFQNWAETAINLYFAERSGIEELQLDDDTAEELRKLAADGKFDPSLISPDNKIRIDYDTATPALKFRVDASTSKMKDDSDQLNALQGLLATLEHNQVLQANIPQEKIIETWNSIVAASGVEDPERLTITPEEAKQHQEQVQQQAAQQAQAQAPQTPQKPLSESISLSDIYKTTTDPYIKAQIEKLVGIEPNPNAQAQQEEINATTHAQHLATQTSHLSTAADNLLPQGPQAPQQGQPLSPTDQQIIQHLKALGISDQVIQGAIQLLEQGASEQEVLAHIGVSHG